MRVVVAARLSQLAEGETGLDTQEQEAVKWAESQGHTVVGIAADHKTGKSHLWERPNLKPWVTEPAKLAEYDALVCLKVDRLTRADDAGVDALKAWARLNGKRIFISSAEVHFPSEGVEGLLWDAYIRMAHQEWLAIRERYMRMQAAKHSAGSLVGQAPWGYEIVKADGVKLLEPTLEGRLYVPKIFGWFADGWSAREVALELTRLGIKSGAPDGKWYESRLIAMVKRTTYSGQRQRKGMAALEVEPLVSRALQDKAVAAIAARARLGASSRTQPKALLAKLLCGHPDCPGNGTYPMYRIHGKYYRCTGRAPQRQGCGAPMVPIAELDSLVLNFAEYWDSREYVSQRFVSGNDAGLRIERLRLEMAEAIKASPSDRIAEVAAEYTERIRALEAGVHVLPHWEDVRTGETEGQHLRSLDLDGQREYLARKNIKAWKDAEGSICVLVDGALARRGGPSVISRG